MNSQLVIGFKDDETRLSFLRDIERLIYGGDYLRDIGKHSYCEDNVVFDIPPVDMSLSSAVDPSDQSLSLGQAIIAASNLLDASKDGKSNIQGKKPLGAGVRNENGDFQQKAEFLAQQQCKLENALMLAESENSGVDSGFKYLQTGEDEHEMFRRVTFYGFNQRGEFAVNTYYLFLDGAIMFVPEDIVEEDGKYWSHPAS